ncbi:hypothetical protein CFK38_10985 [Brachybacterium vulturis]|uniref:Uncharacterized protein n=1 Tax=Brachybacterium vulturis TaxID=2017484 RepID=A0A291GP33_9MICO|nr:hypothetical protein [Brachybacterium vulturis]ATG51985.1 hypothetical protein CFK38_10985 [Brachybacterium vulturis]
MTQGRSFNPPPNWPEPPHDGWIPPAGFSPGRSWGPVPAGWRLWSSATPEGRGSAPLQASEDVPASGARPRRRVDRYPVAVLNPGMWADNHLESEDYGFPPAAPRTDRPRLRLGVTIAVTALGFVLAAATALMFVMIVDFGIEDLAGVLDGAAGHLDAAAAGAGAGSPVHG